MVLTPQLYETWTEALRAEAAALLQLEPSSPVELGRCENIVYRVRSRQRSLILRITHRSHRTPAALDAEWRFIAAMIAAGIPACAGVPAPDGRAVVPIGTQWLAMLFEDAGSPPAVAPGAPWSVEQLRTWGRMLGAMHAAARALPTLGGRLRWREEPVIAAVLGDEDAEVRQVAETAVRSLESRADAVSGLRLIHADLHTGNLLRSADGTIRIFDFDDARYHWPLYDIAVCANSMPAGDGDGPARRALRTANLRSFLDGYALAESAPRDVELLARLLRLRDLEMFAWVRLRDGGVPGERATAFRNRCRAGILAGETLVDPEVLLR